MFTGKYLPSQKEGDTGEHLGRERPGETGIRLPPSFLDLDTGDLIGCVAAERLRLVRRVSATQSLWSSGAASWRGIISGSLRCINSTDSLIPNLIFILLPLGIILPSVALAQIRKLQLKLEDRGLQAE